EARRADRAGLRQVTGTPVEVRSWRYADLPVLFARRPLRAWKRTYYRPRRDGRSLALARRPAIHFPTGHTCKLPHYIHPKLSPWRGTAKSWSLTRLVTPE